MTLAYYDDKINSNKILFDLMRLIIDNKYYVPIGITERVDFDEIDI